MDRYVVTITRWFFLYMDMIAMGYIYICQMLSMVISEWKNYGIYPNYIYDYLGMV